MPRRKAAVASRKSQAPAGNGQFDGAERELEILEAAAGIFNQKGYDRTSIQDIAEEVGMLKGSLYYYISSKDDLLHQIFDQVHRGALDAVREVFERQGPADERMHDLIVRQTVFYCRYHVWIGVFLHEYKTVQGPMKTRSLKMRSDYEQNVRKIIADGQAQGVFRPDVDVPLTTRAILGMTNWLYTWYSPRGRRKPEEIGEAYADLVLHALRAAPIGARRRGLPRVTEPARS
jgi:AcrR family transcriptional regulator